MLVAVDPAALAGWAADARSATDRLSGHVRGVDDVVRPMAAAWSGEAAGRFDEHYTRWLHAARDLAATLTELAALVDTAHANYTAAASANARIWGGGAPASGPALVHAMSAGAAPRGIHAETDDIRSTVAALVAAADALAGGWLRLAGALAGTGAMAGDDPAGAAFGHDVDATAAAAWQGWRSGTILLGACAGGLAATGNNLIKAESDSTAGPVHASEPITASPRPLPGLPGAPSAVGDNGSRSVVEPVASNWPTASPERLRAAAAAWRASGETVKDVAGQAGTAVTGLVANNPDPALQQMRAFADRLLTLDPVSGLFGALAVACGDIAGACEALAGATDRTRSTMAAAVAEAVTGEEWYDPVAAVLDAVLTRGAARVVAAGGHAMGLALTLGWIGSEHAAAVRAIRAEVSPAAADHLARLATPLVPPTPITAATCAVTSPVGAAGAPAAESERQALIAAAQAEGKKLDPAAVLQIARTPDGRVVWLERGDERSGLAHILRAERIRDFAIRGVPLANIPGIAVRAVTEGVPIGRITGDGVAYDVDVGGGRYEKIVVIVGSNGYIVSAYPLSTKAKLRPM